MPRTELCPPTEKGGDIMYDIFLSYRRETGSEFASFLEYRLTQMGYSVFFDANCLRDGAFEPKIDRAIDECTFFLLLLAPGDLDRCFKNPERDWIVHEAQRAIDNGKHIVPIQIREGFQFPEACALEPIKTLSKINLCDLSGVKAAQLVDTLLVEYLNDVPAKQLADKYNKGIIDPEYIEWEQRTLKSIYHDIPLVNVWGKDFPALVIPGAEAIKFPFDSLTKEGSLLPIEEPLQYEQTPWFNDFRKIVGPHIHYPNLYGFTSCGFNRDSEGKILSMQARPRTYKETVYTCHILQYELWTVYQKIGKERIATLEDLPMRKAIHDGHSNLDVLLSGCNRSALNDVTIAVIDYNDQTEAYCIATATRSENVATHPGYFGFVPSGGFELYELEENQSETVIQENYAVIGALYREYIEELFGDTSFGKATGNDDLNRLYRNSNIKSLRKGVRAGTYKFEFLGVIFDLTTLRQTLAFVLRIDDEDFYYSNEIRKNEENRYVKMVSLRSLDKLVTKDRLPVMVESAAAYSLLKENHLYREMEETGFCRLL